MAPEVPLSPSLLQMWLRTQRAAQVEANKDRSLQRRVQTLQRFLLDHFRIELAARRAALPPSDPAPEQPQQQAVKIDKRAPEQQLADGSEPATAEAQAMPDEGLLESESPGLAAEEAATCEEAAQDEIAVAAGPEGRGQEVGALQISEAAADLPPGDGLRAADAPAGERVPQGAHAAAAKDEEAAGAKEDLVSMLDGLFGVTMEQRTRCLGGSKAERTQESTAYQVRWLRGLSQKQTDLSVIYPKAGLGF